MTVPLNREDARHIQELRRSTDPQDWAKAFMSVFSGRSGSVDERTMTAWFADYRGALEEGE